MTLKMIAVLAALSSVMAQPCSGGEGDMAFKYVGREVYADGVISPGTTERFLAFVQERSVGSIVFNSPGGSLIEGLKLGKAIRNKLYDTNIGTFASSSAHGPGICASACTFAFAGGVLRGVAAGSRFGVHQFYTNSPSAGDMGAAQVLSSEIIAYLRVAGIKPAMFDMMARTKSSDVKWLTPAELADLNVVTGNERTVFAVSTIDGAPALTARTGFAGYDGQRIDFVCGQNGLDALIYVHNSTDGFDLPAAKFSWTVGDGELGLTLTKHRYPIPGFKITANGDQYIVRLPLTPIVPLKEIMETGILDVSSEAPAGGRLVARRMEWSGDGPRFFELIAMGCSGRASSH